MGQNLLLELTIYSAPSNNRIPDYGGGEVGVFARGQKAFTHHLQIGTIFYT